MNELFLRAPQLLSCSNTRHNKGLRLFYSLTCTHRTAHSITARKLRLHPIAIDHKAASECVWGTAAIHAGGKSVSRLLGSCSCCLILTQHQCPWLPQGRCQDPSRSQGSSGVLVTKLQVLWGCRQCQGLSWSWAMQGVLPENAEVRCQLWASSAAGVGRALCRVVQVSRVRAWYFQWPVWTICFPWGAQVDEPINEEELCTWDRDDPMIHVFLKEAFTEVSENPTAIPGSLG